MFRLGLIINPVAGIGGSGIITLGALLGSRTPVSGRALFREVRASFYRTLFLAFVAAVVVPVVALALVTMLARRLSLRLRHVSTRLTALLVRR